MATVTYRKQPAIHKTRGSVPLSGTSHIYTVGGVLWPDAVEEWIASKIVGSSLHICCGKSKIGDVRIDLFEPYIDVKADAARLPFPDRSFTTTIIDPPYNGSFQWNHDMINELIRVTEYRIIFQHWFLIANKDGQLKKAHVFELQELVYTPDLAMSKDSELVLAIYDKKAGTYTVAVEALGDDDVFNLTGSVAWQPRTYFGRAQILQIYDRGGVGFHVKKGYEQLGFSELGV
jgi:hypothetical protein